MYPNFKKLFRKSESSKQEWDFSERLYSTTGMQYREGVGSELLQEPHGVLQPEVISH